MDASTWIAVTAGAVTSIGGFFGGRRMATAGVLAVATDTVTLLETQLQVIQAREAEKEAVIRGLANRIEVLEGMVLQREDLSQLKIDVRLIKEKLDA